MGQPTKPVGPALMKGMRPPLSPTLSARSGITSASGATRASKMEWGEVHAGPDIIVTRYQFNIQRHFRAIQS